MLAWYCSHHSSIDWYGIVPSGVGQCLSLAVVQLCPHGHDIQEAARARSEGGAYISCMYILATSTANKTYSVASDIKHSVSHLFSGRCLAECLNHTGMGCYHEREIPILEREVIDKIWLLNKEYLLDLYSKFGSKQLSPFVSFLMILSQILVWYL